MRIEELPIETVWYLLGGGPLRGNRGRAFWRDGDGFNIALNQGTWYDHASATGGGIVALVELSTGGDRRAALAWLAENFGIVTGDRRTAGERRAYARNIDRARTAAAALVERRDLYLTDLRTASGILLAEYHRLTTKAEAELDIELAAQAETVFAKLDEIAARRDWLRAASVPELAGWFVTLDEWKDA